MYNPTYFYTFVRLQLNLFHLYVLNYIFCDKIEGFLVHILVHCNICSLWCKGCKCNSGLANKATVQSGRISSKANPKLLFSEAECIGVPFLCVSDVTKSFPQSKSERISSFSKSEGKRVSSPRRESGESRGQRHVKDPYFVEPTVVGQMAVLENIEAFFTYISS